MNKPELAAVISDVASLSKGKAVEVANIVFNTIATALKRGEEVRIAGFGSFATVQREARTGRNPSTREEVEIPASVAVKFKAGKDLKEAVQAA